MLVMQTTAGLFQYVWDFFLCNMGTFPKSNMKWAVTPLQTCRTVPSTDISSVPSLCYATCREMALWVCLCLSPSPHLPLAFPGNCHSPPVPQVQGGLQEIILLIKLWKRVQKPETINTPSVLKTGDVCCHCWLEASTAKQVGSNFEEQAAQAECSQRVSGHCPQTRVTASLQQEMEITSKTTIPLLSGFLNTNYIRLQVMSLRFLYTVTLNVAFWQRCSTWWWDEADTLLAAAAAASLVKVCAWVWRCGWGTAALLGPARVTGPLTGWPFPLSTSFRLTPSSHNMPARFCTSRRRRPRSCL